MTIETVSRACAQRTLAARQVADAEVRDDADEVRQSTFPLFIRLSPLR